LEILPLQIARTILVAELSSSQCSTMRIRNRVKKRLFAYLQKAPPVVTAGYESNVTQRLERLGHGTALAELAPKKIEMQKEISI
jgi:hypothetical protein